MFTRLQVKNLLNLKFYQSHAHCSGNFYCMYFWEMIFQSTLPTSELYWYPLQVIAAAQFFNFR